VSLAFLASVVYQHYRSFDAAAWIQVATVFTAIVLIWHGYVFGVAAFSWIPTLADTFIPFAFFAVEIGLSAAIPDRRDLYLFGLGALCLAAFAGFRNMDRNARRYEENAGVLKAMAGLVAITQYYLLAMFPVCILSGLIASRLPALLASTLALVGVLVMAGLVSRMSLLRRKCAEGQHMENQREGSSLTILEGASGGDPADE
jgi:hypothetical protein